MIGSNERPHIEDPVDRPGCEIGARAIACTLQDIASGAEFQALSTDPLSLCEDGRSFLISRDGMLVSFYCEDGGLSYVESCRVGVKNSVYGDWIYNPLDFLSDSEQENLEVRFN